MSTTLMRLNFYVKSLSKWHHAHVKPQSFLYSQRKLTTLTGNLCGDTTKQESPSPPPYPLNTEQKMELNEPIGIDRLRKYFDNEIENGDCVPVFKRALLYGNRIAIKDSTGEYSYREILNGARKLAIELSAYNRGKYAVFHTGLMTEFHLLCTVITIDSIF